MAAFGLQKELVMVLFGETDHLVLDRGAVAGAHPLDHPAIHGGLVQILADDLVRAEVRVGDPAVELFHVEHAIPPLIEGKDVPLPRPQRLREVREEAGRGVPPLSVAHGEIDGPGIEPARGAGLKPPHFKAEGPQTVA